MGRAPFLYIRLRWLVLIGLETGVGEVELDERGALARRVPRAARRVPRVRGRHVRPRGRREGGEAGDRGAARGVPEEGHAVRFVHLIVIRRWGSFSLGFGIS